MVKKNWDPNHCAVCTPPLNPENQEAVRIFMLVRDQLIMAPMGGPVAVDHTAIHGAMRIYRKRIADPEKCFEQVLDLCAMHISKLHEPRDKTTV